MSKLFYGHVDVKGTKIHYYRTSDDKPNIVFLHGITDNGMCWSRLAFYLEQYFDVILIDARGHGLSEAPDSGYDVEVHAEDVAAVIQNLDLQPVALVGHSMGGSIAVATAASYPKLVKSLILEDPPFRENSWLTPQETRQEHADKLKEWIAELRKMPLEDLELYCKQNYPSWHEDDQRLWASARLQVRPQVTQFISGSPFNWMEKIQNLKCPGLMLTGNPEKGAIINSAVSTDITRLWKSCQVVNVPDAGHNIRRDQYIPTRDAIRKFLFQNQ